MSIILNEKEWVENALAASDLGKKPFETMCRVARYYIDQGHDKQDTRSLLDRFLLQCDPMASLPKWANTLDYAISRAVKYNSVQIDYIEITKPEMDRIDSLPSKQIRRLAFTLLCLAKYWVMVLPQSDYWVINKDTEIMSLANINTSIRRQSLMYNTLQQLDMIQFAKKVDNTNVKVLFVEDGEVVMKIDDFRNLGYQYLMYHGEPFFRCENCGLITKHKSDSRRRPPKYCPECARDIYIQQTVNSVMRRRGKSEKYN